MKSGSTYITGLAKYEESAKAGEKGPERSEENKIEEQRWLEEF